MTAHISRHSVNLTDVAELYDLLHNRSDPRTLIERDVDNLSVLAGNAAMLFQCGVVSGKAVTDLKRHLRLAAECWVALFKASVSTSKMHQVTIGDLTIKSPGEVDESLVNIGKWLNAYFFSLLAGFPEAISALCAVSCSKLKRSSTWRDASAYVFRDALEAFAKGARNRLAKVDVAIKACAKSRERWVKDLQLPQLQIMRTIVIGSEPDFEDSVLSALRLHKRYWGSTAERLRDTDGFVAFEIAALVAFAKREGLACSVTSDYLPTEFT